CSGAAPDRHPFPTRRSSDLVSASSGKPMNAITVSGNVTSSSDGLGLPGANVLVKGTFTGTVTDIDGYYSLNVPNATDTLVFSSRSEEHTSELQSRENLVCRL